MAPLSLVMPMAGRGSRFSRAGRVTPKPLIMLQGKPLFVWAVESLRQAVPLGEMIFVVLSEHIRDHAIDVAIGERYPTASLVVLDTVTNSAAETAALGARELKSSGPFAINACDHAFLPRDLPGLVSELEAGAASALLGFPSTDPDQAYVRLNRVGCVIETACGQLIGRHAIAGCNLFGERAGFLDRFGRYRAACPGQDLSLSGLCGAMARDGDTVLFQPLQRRVTFGAPEELAQVGPHDLDFLAAVPAPVRA